MTQATPGTGSDGEAATLPRPDLSVVTVTHNGRELALRTLASAMAATGGARVEWILVDNDSSDGTAEAVEAAHPEVAVLRRANRGFAAGNNAGLESCRGRYVLLLNPDVDIDVGTLADLVALLDARPEVGAGGVIQRSSHGVVFPSAWRFPSASRQWGEALLARRWPVARGLQEAQVDERSYFVEHDVDWVTGSFLIVRREALDQVGPMDERFFLYSEETDWCRRIRGAGWAIRHLPQLQVTHHHGAGIKPGLTAHLTHSKRLYAEKHMGRVERRLFVAALAARHALRLAALRLDAARTGDRHANRIEAEAVGLRVALGRVVPRRPA